MTGVVCFMCLWKRGLCPQALQISLLELTRNCVLDLHCLRIASLSLAHRAQLLVAKGLPCQMMLQVVPPRLLVGDGFVSQNWVAKCFAHESDFSPSLTSFWTSLKCCCILFLNFCCVFPMLTFPVLLPLALQTAVEFLHMLLWPQLPFPPVLQLQGRGQKSWDVSPTVSFLERSHWKTSLRLVNLWWDMKTLNHWRLNLSLMDLMIWMDWFRPDVGMSNAKADSSSSVVFVVGIVISLFDSFGFFVVLHLFSQCWDFFGDQSCILWSLEALWVDFVQWQVLVSFRDCCQFRQSFADLALQHALAWMLSAFGCFSC